MIYTVVANGKVFRYNSLPVLKRAHGEGAAYQVFTNEDLKEAEKRMKVAKLYAHNGAAVIGKTDGEKAVIEKLQRAEAIKQQLEAADRKAGAGRAVRGLALAAAAAQGITGGRDYASLQELETRAGALRAELQEVQAGVEGMQL